MRLGQRGGGARGTRPLVLAAVGARAWRRGAGTRGRPDLSSGNDGGSWIRRAVAL